MGSNQKPAGRASTLVTSQWLLLVVVALALAACAASTGYTRHMWNRVDDAIDTFAAESVYGLSNISATRETLWKVDSLLHREVLRSSDLELKAQVDELRSELGTDGDRLVAERPERDDLGKAAADLRALQEIVDRVQEAATAGDRVEARATRLIDDLLEVTRIEAGNLVLEHHSIAAAEIVRGVAEAQGAIVSASSLELQIDVVEQLPAVWVDRDRLEQVFANLIANSVNFTPAGGRITIGAAPTEGGPSSSGSRTLAPGSTPRAASTCSIGSGKRGRASAAGSVSVSPSSRASSKRTEGASRSRAVPVSAAPSTSRFPPLRPSRSDAPFRPDA